MSFSEEDKVTVISARAPFFGQSGVVSKLDDGYKEVRLVGVLLAGAKSVAWYNEIELGPADVDAATEQIPAVTG